METPTTRDEQDAQAHGRPATRGYATEEITIRQVSNGYVVGPRLGRGEQIAPTLDEALDHARALLARYTG